MLEPIRIATLSWLIPQHRSIQQVVEQPPKRQDRLGCFGIVGANLPHRLYRRTFFHITRAMASLLLTIDSKVKFDCDTVGSKEIVLATVLHVCLWIARLCDSKCASGACPNVQRHLGQKAFAISASFCSDIRPTTWKINTNHIFPESACEGFFVKKQPLY